MSDSLRRALAVLELTPGVSRETVKHQYRLLVKKWHPDKYADDPQGQAEATLRLRQINDAYRRILLEISPGAPTERSRAAGPAARKAPSYGTGRRLSKIEIERIIEEIGRYRAAPRAETWGHGCRIALMFISMEIMLIVLYGRGDVSDIFSITYFLVFVPVLTYAASTAMKERNRITRLFLTLGVGLLFMFVSLTSIHMPRFPELWK